MFLATLIFYTGWLVIALYLYSSGKQVYDASNMLPFGQMQMNNTIRQLFWIHLFGLFWGTAFLMALG